MADPKCGVCYGAGVIGTPGAPCPCCNPNNERFLREAYPSADPKGQALTREQIEEWFDRVDEWITFALDHQASPYGAESMRKSMEQVKELALSSLTPEQKEGNHSEKPNSSFVNSAPASVGSHTSAEGGGALCKARTGNTGANDPQDCNWPFCGCDPYADRVIDAIEEAGFPISSFPGAAPDITALVERINGLYANVRPVYPWAIGRVEPSNATASHNEPYSPWFYPAGPRSVMVDRSICIHADDMALIAELVNHWLLIATALGSGTSPSPVSEPVMAALEITGNIVVLEPDGGTHHTELGMLLRFGNVVALRQAIVDGACRFDFAADALASSQGKPPDPSPSDKQPAVGGGTEERRG